MSLRKETLKNKKEEFKSKILREDFRSKILKNCKGVGLVITRSERKLAPTRE
jgi:hypothetical protein